MKRFDYIPTIESSIRAAGTKFNNLYNDEEFASIAQQISALNAEFKAIDVVLDFLNAPSSDLRDNINLLDEINIAYQQFSGSASAIHEAKTHQRLLGNHLA